MVLDYIQCHPSFSSSSLYFFEQIRFVLGSIRLPLDDLHVVETHAIFTEHFKDV